ncbi:MULTISPECIES: pentapeptide repeat-containing protein [Hyphobacterium]|uniref:Pentapeptide repeat-containing protein n=1 Tax=Hyphobacterium vulgare TaxID=1736751 RepID=A0ABV7A157_9PROT
MKRLLATAALFALSVSPALAQDASQIARVQSGASCSGCNLFQADLAYRDLPNVNLSGSRLRQADLSLTTMNGANLSACDLSVANLFGARFTGVSFRNSNLRDANLVGGYFGGADFTGADLTGALLSGAEMRQAHGLTQSQLNTACGDTSTELPPGLRVPSCR